MLFFNPLPGLLNLISNISNLFQRLEKQPIKLKKTSLNSFGIP